MKEVVYLDVFFVWNFVMDLVCLLLAGTLASEKTKPFRLILAAALGAFSATVFLCLSPGKVWEFFLGLLAFFPMVLTSFGFRSPRRLFLVSLMGFATSFFLSGAVEYLSYYAGKSRVGLSLGIFSAAVFLALGAFSFWGKSLRRKMESCVISLSISYEDREEQFYGLVDSGAFLRDPESGCPVILMKAEYASDLVGFEKMEALKKGEGEGVVPIPVRTASGRGLLYAFRPVAVRFHRLGKKTKQESCLVALDFSGGGFGGCPCLVPLSVV